MIGCPELGGSIIYWDVFRLQRVSYVSEDWLVKNQRVLTFLCSSPGIVFCSNGESHIFSF